MPCYEDALGSKDFFSLDKVLCKVFSVVRHLCPHIVNHERLSEVEFVVREWHCLEVQSHHGSTLNISELVATSCSVTISIEEFCHRLSVLWEVWVVKTLLPFLIVVHDVVSFRGEQFPELIVFENRIKDPDLVDSWFSTPVTNTGSRQQ